MAKYITISSSFHPTICTERARDLAMEILKTRSKKSGGDSEVRKRLQGLEATSKEGMKMETPRIISNYYSSDGRSNTFERRKCPSTKTTKVSLNEAPDNDDFDRYAQEIMRKLDKKETAPGELSLEKGSPINDQHRPPCQGRERHKEKGRWRKEREEQPKP